MTRRSAARLAWSLFAVSLAAYLTMVVLLVLNAGSPARVSYGTRSSFIFIGLAYLAFPIVGALIASRRPGNPVGWLMVAMGPAFGVQALAWEWALYALVTNPGFPGGAVAIWLTGWVWVPPIATMATFLLLLFPDGSLPSPRWRPVAWTAGLVIGLGTIGFAFGGGELVEAPVPGVQNPYGFLGGAGEVFQSVFLLAPVLFLASAASLVVRYRRSGGEQQAQLRWLAYAAAVLASGFLLVFVLSLPRIMSDLERDLPTWLAVFQDVVTLSVAGIPVAVGFAILKYRLYDIDRVINQTVVYGLLTAVLVGIYVGAVAGIGAVARAFTGQESNSLVIVVSTLAVAALFRPLRARLQTFIDRRFYRQRYDAAATLDRFSTRLRDQVDLESLRSEVVAVVGTTMQPAHASVWLRPREEAR